MSELVAKDPDTKKAFDWSLVEAADENLLFSIRELIMKL